MEKGSFDTPAPLEHDDVQRRKGIASIAIYLAFEHTMRDVDAGKCTREAAFEYVKALRPLLVQGSEATA